MGKDSKPKDSKGKGKQAAGGSDDTGSKGKGKGGKGDGLGTCTYVKGLLPLSSAKILVRCWLWLIKIVQCDSYEYRLNILLSIRDD